MPCSLTYDDELSRVRVDATSLCTTGVVDTYSRTAVSGWTSTDTGQAWTVTGGSAGDYNVTGGTGRQNVTTELVTRLATLNLGTTDCDFMVSVATDKLAAGSSQIVELVGRRTDDNNQYHTRVAFQTTAAVQVSIRKAVAGVETVIFPNTIISGLTHAANTFFTIRFQIIGTQLRVKVWPTSGSEPSAWTETVTDTSVTVGTRIGVRSFIASGTSNEPILFSFDNLRTAVVDHAVVDRTTDGVTYTVVRGATDVGVTVTGCALEHTVDDYEFPVGVPVTYRVRSFTDGDYLGVTTTCQITVNLDQVWFKSIGRPFLNQVMDCVLNPSPVTRRARNGISPIVGRSFPVATTDLRMSREVTVQVVTQTTEQRQDLDLLLASGDPIFVQTPAGHPLPTMYAVIEDTAEERPVLNRLCNNDWRLWSLPLVEVAAPGPDVVGSTSTWQTVVSTYATWADVMLAHPSWADLLELIGDGTEVIVL